jgi:AAA+ superfamily predicted ATPase
VRSYFLNEIDGLQSNDGIFIVGSTNHLERLDPGISVSSRHPRDGVDKGWLAG